MTNFLITHGRDLVLACHTLFFLILLYRTRRVKINTTNGAVHKWSTRKK